MKSLITCKDCVDLLMEYVEHSLDASMEHRLDEHLASCPPCIHFLKSYKKCSELTSQLRDQKVQIPAELENRLKLFLKQELTKGNEPLT